MYIGEIIKNKRMELGITQTELANAVGCTYQTIYHLERGDSCTMGVLSKVCEVLKLTIEIK